jgi:hypothetical protein
MKCRCNDTRNSVNRSVYVGKVIRFEIVRGYRVFTVLAVLNIWNFVNVISCGS